MTEKIHPMTLAAEPFAAVQSGRKIVELRLFDEKRRQLREGDGILFSEVGTGETVRVTVTALRRFPDFASLYACYDKAAMGYREDETADPADMLRYYSAEQIRACGVLAIEIRRELGTAIPVLPTQAKRR